MPTLLDHISDSGLPVISVGKISDIFAGKGITKSVKASDNDGVINQLLGQMNKIDAGLIFANLVDFDSKFGHRRDVPGYANAIEEFDERLPEIINQLHENDLVLITADHGCDPTWKGTDHTREHVPVLFFKKHFISQNLGPLSTFADMGATIAHHLKVSPLVKGEVCKLN
jgi:phosphopentomutase